MKDADAQRCCNSHCDAVFGLIVRRHHCRCCGEIFCASCAKKQQIPAALAQSDVSIGTVSKARICTACYSTKVLRRIPQPSAHSPLKRVVSGSLLTDAFSDESLGEIDDEFYGADPTHGFADERRASIDSFGSNLSVDSHNGASLDFADGHDLQL